MTLPASTQFLPSSSPPKFHIKAVFRQQPCQLQKSLFLGNGHWSSSKRTIRATMSAFGGSEEVKMHINVTKEKLRKAIPDPVKEADWNKALDILLERLLSLGKKAFKWSIIVLFCLSSGSDFVFSVTRNQELGKGLDRSLIGIGCFFVLVKCISMNFRIRGKIFLLHVANGGFMQVLWLWKTLLKGKNGGIKENSLSVQDSSLSLEAKD